MRIGNHEVHPGVLWSNEHTEAAVSQQTLMSLGGLIDITHMAYANPLMVFSTKGGGNKVRGYFKRSLIIYVREAESLGSPVTVIYRGVTYSMVVKAGGVAVTEMRETETVTDDDPFIGSLSFYNTTGV